MSYRDQYLGHHRIAARPTVVLNGEIPHRRGGWTKAIVLALAVAVNVVVIARLNVPVFRASAGFWLAFVLPVYLLFTTSLWRGCDPTERLAYSVCSVLLTLMAAGLVLNTVLPLMGMDRPLGTDETLAVVDAIALASYLLRRRYPDGLSVRPCLTAMGKREFRLLALATLSVPLAVLGANRLNNGADGNITLIALTDAAIVLFVAVRWIRLLRDAVLYAVIYLISLSLLLSTSLRGWYVTGHDIQEEYHVFQLTSVHAHWSMSYFHDAYTACLSITILPTELARIIHVDDPYVYKLFFQAIFALCPVFAYGISRRYFNRVTSLLSTVYFIGFPTFFTDMPFLNRQEISLLFVAAGTLAVTNRAWSVRRRQISIVLLGVGVEVSHYSSMYIFIGILGIAWALRYGISILSRIRPGRFAARERSLLFFPIASTGLAFIPVVMLVGVTVLWGGLVTGTSGQLVHAGESALSGVSGSSSGTRASSVSFSVLGGASTSPSTVLRKYRETTIARTASNKKGLYLPEAAVLKAPTSYIPQQTRPLSAVGVFLNSWHIPVVDISSLTRSLIAYCEQVFLLVGLLSLAIARRRARQSVAGDLFWLAMGGVTVLGLITVLPSVSADYGVLRAFQEALIFFGPVIVVGSATLFRPLGGRHVKAWCAAVCLGLFVNTSGLMPQLLGGNIAELNLNNSGNYYNLFYMRPQDETAVSWLEKQPHVSSYPIQSSYLQTKYLFTGAAFINGPQAIGDAYPTLVIRSSWLILGNLTVNGGYAYTHASGDPIEYKYPKALLNDYKNLVYTNGETVIYK